MNRDKTFRWLYAIAIAILLVIVAVRGEATRSDTDRIDRIVTQSACKTDPRGGECQQILTDSIKAFDRETICILARKLGTPCERRKGEQDGSTNQSTGGNDAPGPDGGSVGDPDPGPGGSDVGDTDAGGGDPPTSGSLDPPGSGDSPSAGGGGSSSGGGPGAGDEPPTTTPPASAPDDDGLIGGLGEGVEGITCGAAGQLGLNPAGICP